MPGEGAVQKVSVKVGVWRARAAANASSSRSSGAVSVYRTSPIALGAESRLTCGRPISSIMRSMKVVKRTRFAHDRALALAAEAAHARTHVREKALARLLAVVADVDAGGELLRHRVLGRRAHLAGESRPIDRLAVARACEELDQGLRPRQAAGVGGEDAGLAAAHAPRVSLRMRDLPEEVGGRLPASTRTVLSLSRAWVLQGA